VLLRLGQAGDACDVAVKSHQDEGRTPPINCPPMREDMGVKISVFFIYLRARNVNKLSCHGNDCDFKEDVLPRGSIQGRPEFKDGFW